MDKEKFAQCCMKFKYDRDKKGIGTYKEKTLHRIVKNYYNSNPECQEIKIKGYVADICEGNEIIEVQTRAFNKLFPKLEAFCSEYNVNVVYPIPYNKWLVWINNETGEITKRRKSPCVGDIYDAFFELYKIKKHLINPHCHITLLFINVDEYRNLNGWSEDRKRGSSREEQIPLELIDEIKINDFNIFIPKNIPEKFTSKDYAKAIKEPLRRAQIGLTILQYCKTIEVVGKDGKANVYKIKKVD